MINPQISNFAKIRPVGAQLFHVDRQTDRQTDMTKLNSPFSLFCRTPLRTVILGLRRFVNPTIRSRRSASADNTFKTVHILLSSLCEQQWLCTSGRDTWAVRAAKRTTQGQAATTVTSGPQNHDQLCGNIWRPHTWEIRREARSSNETTSYISGTKPDNSAWFNFIAMLSTPTFCPPFVILTWLTDHTAHTQGDAAVVTGRCLSDKIRVKKHGIFRTTDGMWGVFHGTRMGDESRALVGHFTHHKVHMDWPNHGTVSWDWGKIRQCSQG